MHQVAVRNKLKRGWRSVTSQRASHLERTTRLAVVRGTFPWDDIGSWDALLRIRNRDAHGNVIVGNVTLGEDVRNSVVWAEDDHIAVAGIKNTVVVRANGYTLVMPTGQAEQLKALVQRL